MHIWSRWWIVVRELRPAFSRTRSFLWFSICLTAFAVRGDLAGISSFIRALGLQPHLYDRMLDFFHSSSLNLEKLTTLWSRKVLEYCWDFLVCINGRCILIGDGIKVPKAGKMMPGVKKLHQESESNTKPTYIFGHSCQVVALLVGSASTYFALPLAGRIHEGLIFSNRDKRTLLDKMLLLLKEVNLSHPYFVVADAYYACRNIASGVLRDGNHLVTRVRKNAVAYRPVPPPVYTPGKRGAKRKYGDKTHLRTMLSGTDTMHKAKSPVAGESGVTIRYRCFDLIWRPIGAAVRFVAVVHPVRGSFILMSTDKTLSPVEILRIYSLRYKIEVSFKQTLHTLGTFAYHFWMKDMTPIGRESGNQHLHHKSDSYRNSVRRKLAAYHRHIQTGLIAHGLLQYLSLSVPKQIYGSFGSWFRTLRKDTNPSELVVATAMRNTLPEFLADSSDASILKEFMRVNIDLERTEGVRMVA